MILGKRDARDRISIIFLYTALYKTHAVEVDIISSRLNTITSHIICYSTASNWKPNLVSIVE